MIRFADNPPLGFSLALKTTPPTAGEARWPARLPLVAWLVILRSRYHLSSRITELLTTGTVPMVIKPSSVFGSRFSAPLRAEERLIVGEERLVYLENVVNAVHDEILHYHVEFIGV